MFRSNQPYNAIQRFAIASKKIRQQEKIQQLKIVRDQCIQDRDRLKAIYHSENRNMTVLTKDLVVLGKKFDNLLANNDHIRHKSMESIFYAREQALELAGNTWQCLSLTTSNKDALFHSLLCNESHAFNALTEMAERTLTSGMQEWEIIKFNSDKEIQQQIQYFLKHDYVIYQRLSQRVKSLTEDIIRLTTELNTIEPKQISQIKVMHKELVSAAKRHDTATYLTYVFGKNIDPENVFIENAIGGYNRKWDDDYDHISLPCHCETCLKILKQLLLHGIMFDFTEYKKQFNNFLPNHKSCDDQYHNGVGVDYFKPSDALFALRWDFSSLFDASRSLQENIVALFENYPKTASLFEEVPHRDIAARIARDLKKDTTLDSSDLYVYFDKLSQELGQSIVESGDAFSRRYYFCLRLLKPYEPRELQELPLSAGRMLNHF